MTGLPDQFRTACALAGITPELALARGRTQWVSIRRQHVMWLLRQRGWSLHKIGNRMDRDHSTIVQGLKHYERIRDLFQSAERMAAE